jgi:hypothetical protein
LRSIISARFAAAADERRGLHRAEAGRGGNLPVRLKACIALDVLNDNALPPLHDDLQALGLRVVELDVAEVRMLQVDGRE